MCTIKRFVLMGILLFSGYFGFAQTAIIRIMSTGDLHNQDVCFELEYRKVGDAWANVVGIVPNWESYGNYNHYTSYALTGLECGEVYEVRIRAYLIDVGEISCGEWSYVEIVIPYGGEDGYFDIICHPVMMNLADLSIPDPNVEVIFSEEGKTTKEAIKEE